MHYGKGYTTHNYLIGEGYFLVKFCLFFALSCIPVQSKVVEKVQVVRQAGRHTEVRWRVCLSKNMVAAEVVSKGLRKEILRSSDIVWLDTYSDHWQAYSLWCPMKVLALIQVWKVLNKISWIKLFYSCWIWSWVKLYMEARRGQS